MFRSKKTGEATFKGQQVVVNPSQDVSLGRKKARRQRILKVLEAGHITTEKRAYLEKAARRLELEIKIAEGEY